MSDELRYALVLLYKKVKGLNPTRRELVMTASMSMRWFSPTDADLMVTMAVESGYLKANGTGVSLTFDPSTVQIPPGFTPTSEIIKIRRTSGDELLPNLVKAISEKTKEEQRKVMAKVNSMVLEMNVDVEVAALILALESGVDAKQFIDKVRLDVMKRYGVRA